MKHSWAFRYRLIREGIYQSIRDLRPDAAGRVLDIGCGHKPYRELFPSSEYLGIDMPATYGEGSSPDVRASAAALPFADASFDCVVCTEVLEHLEEPGRAVAEMARILKPGGCLLASAPFIWPLHEQPRDFFRFTRYGLEKLLAENGLEASATMKRGGFWSVMVQLASDHWHPRGKRNRMAAAIADRLWALPQWAASKLDAWRKDPDYALGWTVKAVKINKGKG